MELYWRNIKDQDTIFTNKKDWVGEETGVSVWPQLIQELDPRVLKVTLIPGALSLVQVIWGLF